MRNLFTSEKQSLSSIVTAKRLQVTMPSIVVEEFYATSHHDAQKPLFNVDFRLQLNFDNISNFDFVHGCTGGMAPILPNTLGAELFLTVDKKTGMPLILQLMGGEAFPLKYFREYIGQIETVLENVLQSSGILQHLSEKRLKQALASLHPKKCRYSRVFVVGDSICFLLFPNEHQPVWKGQRHVLLETNDGKIACFTDESQIVCVDGWISTEVSPSEWKLVAVPDN